MERIYVCSPLHDTSEENMRKNMLFARTVCQQLTGNGISAWAPHAWLPEFLNDNNPSERDMALKLGLDMLRMSDKILICGNRISSGMKGEITLAQQLNIPIIYYSVAKEDGVA